MYISYTYEMKLQFLEIEKPQKSCSYQFTKTISIYFKKVKDLNSIFSCRDSSHTGFTIHFYLLKLK